MSDPFVYKNGNVLRNKLNLRNQKDLDQYESVVFQLSFIKLIASIWHIHPFREGNTRTIVVFLYFLLKQHNLILDIKLLEKHSKYFRNALVLASIGEYSEYEHLEKILKDVIFSSENGTKERDKSTSTKYSKIKDLKLSNYKYNYHTKKQLISMKPL